MLIAHPFLTSLAAVRCSSARPLDLLHPSCDAQNLFWHLRGTADQAQVDDVRGRREARRTPRTSNPQRPKPRRTGHSPASSAQRGAALCAGCAEKQQEPQILSSQEPTSRRSSSKHHTRVSGDIPPRTNGIPISNKSPEGSCGLRPIATPRPRGLASTSRDGLTYEYIYLIHMYFEILNTIA